MKSDVLHNIADGPGGENERIGDLNEICLYLDNLGFQTESQKIRDFIEEAKAFAKSVRKIRRRFSNVPYTLEKLYDQRIDNQDAIRQLKQQFASDDSNRSEIK